MQIDIRRKHRTFVFIRHQKPPRNSFPFLQLPFGETVHLQPSLNPAFSFQKAVLPAAMALALQREALRATEDHCRSLTGIVMDVQHVLRLHAALASTLRARHPRQQDGHLPPRPDTHQDRRQRPGRRTTDPRRRNFQE